MLTPARTTLIKLLTPARTTLIKLLTPARTTLVPHEQVADRRGADRRLRLRAGGDGRVSPRRRRTGDGARQPRTARRRRRRPHRPGDPRRLRAHRVLRV